MQLAALALPADPPSLAFVPAPGAMEEEEALPVVGRGAMPRVQARDPLGRRRDEPFVVCSRLGRVVGPVREEGEAELVIGVGEVVHLELGDQLLDVGLAAEQRGHHHQRPQLGRHPVAQLELRQGSGADPLDDPEVRERDGEVGGRNESQQGEEQEAGSAHAGVRGEHQGRGEDERAQQRDRPQVGRHGRGEVGAGQPLSRANAKAELVFERRASLREQVISGVMPALVSGIVRRGSLLRTRHHPAGHLDLRAAGAPRQVLDRVAVAVAGREVERREVRAGAEYLVDPADAFEELLPVETRHEAHARDDVADGHVHGPLPVVLEAHDLFRRRALGREPLLEPAQRRHDVRILLAQALDELHGEGRGQPLLLDARQRRGCVRRRPSTEAEQPVGEHVGLLARRPVPHDPLREPPEVLDQEDAQRDGDRPQLPDRERLHALIGVHEPPQGLGLEAAVRVRHECPGDPEDPGVTLQEPGRELGQLAVEAVRQILADLADLVVHDVEIVDQPLGRRGDRALLADRFREGAVGSEESTAVVDEPRQQAPPAARVVRYALRGREALGVLLESLNAEELSADGLFGVREGIDPGAEVADKA